MNKRTAPALLAVFAIGLFLTACTTFESNSGKAIKSVVLSVEAARQAWVQYVTDQRVLIPNPADRQDLEVKVAKVGEAYAKYQTAMRGANKALTLYHMAPQDQPAVTTALQALYAASSDIIAIITSFMPAK